MLFFFFLFFKQKLCTLTLFASTQNDRSVTSPLKMIMQKKCCVRSNIFTQRRSFTYLNLFIAFFTLLVHN